MVSVVGTYVQDLALADELLMNGLNGLPLRVEHPEDRLGLFEDASNHTFCTMHLCSTGMLPTADESARRAIGQLAAEAFRFGQLTEHHEQLLLDCQQIVEAYIKELKSTREQAVSQV